MPLIWPNSAELKPPPLASFASIVCINPPPPD